MTKNNEEHNNDIAIGANIKLIRKSRGISQEKLGNHLGVTFQQIQKIENGKNRVGGGRLVIIANFLQVDVIELLKGTSLLGDENTNQTEILKVPKCDLEIIGKDSNKTIVAIKDSYLYG